MEKISFASSWPDLHSTVTQVAEFVAGAVVSMVKVQAGSLGRWIDLGLKRM